jgi:hypothetical protein
MEKETEAWEEKVACPKSSSQQGTESELKPTEHPHEFSTLFSDFILFVIYLFWGFFLRQELSL